MPSISEAPPDKIQAAPPIRRRSFAYRPFLPEDRPADDAWTSSWKRAALRRRLTLLVLTILSGIYGGAVLHFILTENKTTVWHKPVVGLFAVLFAWIAGNFWVSVFGFWVMRRKGDRFDASQALHVEREASAAPPRTAIVVPVYNEDASQVFSSVRAACRSAERAGTIGGFDFFVLSDTSDPDRWVAEEMAWNALRGELGPAGRVYYRRRRNRSQKKSGNVADFCRRWGSNYKYMIVLDADSLITGDLAARLVTIMEMRPDIGILQTIPRAVNQKSLIARAHQFAGHVYGPLFTAGLHFWQLGDAGFWGHNAIVRVETFMRFAALPKLPKNRPFGGDILSHDFVEAALLRRSGLGVWLAYDLEGSYEQVPPNLLTELDRDRRWCQGNLQHFHFLLMKGTSFGYRLLLVIGNFFYISSFLWLMFLFSATFSLVEGRLRGIEYFPSEHALYPEWPVYHHALSALLMGMTTVFLFAPKVLSVMSMLARRRAAEFGGAAKLWAGVAVEIAISMLLAPVRMLFHSYYVFLILIGRKIDWKAPPRSEQKTGLVEALAAHLPGSFIACAWGLAVYYIDRTFIGWALLFIFPLVVAAATSMATSRVDAGRALERAGLLVIPEEKRLPAELEDFQEGLKLYGRFSGETAVRGFAIAAADPAVNALHRALLRDKRAPRIAAILDDRQALIRKAVASGPASLERHEKLRLLSDAGAMRCLHEALVSAAR